jgi:hypothetical protein
VPVVVSSNLTAPTKNQRLGVLPSLKILEFSSEFENLAHFAAPRMLRIFQHSVIVY